MSFNKLLKEPLFLQDTKIVFSQTFVNKSVKKWKIYNYNILKTVDEIRTKYINKKYTFTTITVRNKIKKNIFKISN